MNFLSCDISSRKKDAVSVVSLVGRLSIGNYCFFSFSGRIGVTNVIYAVLILMVSIRHSYSCLESEIQADNPVALYQSR